MLSGRNCLPMGNHMASQGKAYRLGLRHKTLQEALAFRCKCKILACLVIFANCVPSTCWEPHECQSIIRTFLLFGFCHSRRVDELAGETVRPWMMTCCQRQDSMYSQSRLLYFGPWKMTFEENWIYIIDLLLAFHLLAEDASNKNPSAISAAPSVIIVIDSFPTIFGLVQN